MINKLINWLKGDRVAKSVELEVPYKVEVQKTEVMPLGIEAVMVAPTAVVPVAAVEVAPVTVKAKYKRADLTAMTKAQLMELVTKHGVEVKARSTKEELVKVLVKV